ncbi:MAG: hypothetical protein JWQ88_365 [Rhodoferax sp.]|nr:hypothetical protein [Rhodoferax sp.]
MNKAILSAVIAAVAVAASFSAQAVTVSYDSTNTNVAGGDFSGKTSYLLPASNVANNTTLFVETFGARNGGANTQGCGLDSPSSLVSLTGGTYDFRIGSIQNVAAAPSGDAGCYAYGPTAGGKLPDVVKVDYTNLLTFAKATSLNYLGLYYGSIDTYNSLTFYNAAGGVITTVTGQSLINQFNGTSGDQQATSSNIYVNLFFSPAEQFTSFSFTTTQVAFEMDNLVVGVNVPSRVPEPASIALLGLGLAALGVTRRRKSKV